MRNVAHRRAGRHRRPIPASVFRPSFQLSFAAVVALIGAWELARREREKDAARSSAMFGAYFGGARGDQPRRRRRDAAVLRLPLPADLAARRPRQPRVAAARRLRHDAGGGACGARDAASASRGRSSLALGWSIDRMLDVARLVAAWSAGIDASPLLSPLALLIGLAALCWFAFFRDRWRLLGPALALPGGAPLRPRPRRRTC